MADGTNTPKKADPVAPGSSKSKKLMGEFFHGALEGLTGIYSQNQGQYIDSPVGNGLVTRQNAKKDVSKYTPGKAYGSNLLSRFSPSSSFREITVRRIGTTQIHSGDSDVDRAVSDALNDVSDVVNVFQDNVRKAFKATDKRLSNLETDVKRVDKRLRTVENDNRNITKRLKEMVKPVVSGKTISPKELKTTLPVANNGGSSSNTAPGSQSSLLGNALTTAVEGIIGVKALKALKLMGSAALIGSVGAATFGMRRTEEDKKSMYDSDVKEYGRTKADILKNRRNFGITGWLNNRLDDVYEKFAGKKKDEKKGSSDQKASEFPSENLELTTKGMMTLESDKDAVITSKTKITLKAPEIVIDGRLNIKQHIVSKSVVTEPAQSDSIKPSTENVESKSIPGKNEDVSTPAALGTSNTGVAAPVTPIRPDLTNASPVISPPQSSVNQEAPENFTLTKGYHPRGTPSLETPPATRTSPQNIEGPKTFAPTLSGAALKGDALRRGVYQAFRNQGYSHQGALVMAGEVARENGFNPNLVFGNHIDPYNRARNSGMFSWQGSRNPELMKFLADRGAIDKNGNIMRDQNALNAQAAFVKHELSLKRYGGGKYNDMLSQPSVDRNAAADVIGRRYIGWRIDDPRYRAAGIRNRTRGYDATARAVAQMQSKRTASLEPATETQQDAVIKTERPKGAYNSLTAKANYMQPSQYGAPGTNIVDVKTAGGHKFRINAASKEAFQRTIEDLERAGMPLGSIGGYNPRPGGIGGRGRMSQHAMGNAMDIGSQTARDVISKESREWIMKNPQKWREILDRNGMISGGDWRNPDLGHIEWSGRKPWLENPELYAERQNKNSAALETRVKGDEPPPIQDLTMTKAESTGEESEKKPTKDKVQDDAPRKATSLGEQTLKEYDQAFNGPPVQTLETTSSQDQQAKAPNLEKTDADAKPVPSAPPNLENKEDAPESEQKQTSSIDQSTQSPAKEYTSSHHQRTEEATSSLRAPRNDAEAQGPTPGSDGYGSGKQDPDGFCALCMA